MPGRILLDTSILVAMLRGDQSFQDALAEADEVFTSVVAVGELYYGARRASQPDESRSRLDHLFATLTVLSCDRLTAEVYSRLKDALRKKGRPIPDNDLWIAATGVQHGLHLACRDQHFNEIDEIQQVRW